MANGSEAGPAHRAVDSARLGGLNRERVRAAALDLVDREGLPALSMRRLGTELGVEAMALYRYAVSKEALLDGVVESLYRELEERLITAPGPATAPGLPAWRAELHRIARATYDTCHAHPRAVPLLATRVPAIPPAWPPAAVLRDHERVLRLLREAGLDDARSAAAFQAFTAWILGYVSVQLRPTVDDPDEPDPALRLGLHRLSAQEMPTLRETATALAKRGGPDGLAVGLDALLDRFTRE
ncbi:MAG: TetR/AcrR family transcriptional regulator [Streptomyces sp.]|nr:TetR/AcrR family transcriptional regulator [Streptomyces sp.]NUT28637.1 TetR/AcrR family transcriptional regulator [Streptomyces sp.]